MSGDGSIVAAGGYNADAGAGSVRVYTFNQIESLWEQLGQDILGNPTEITDDVYYDFFGYYVALSSDGRILAAAAGETGSSLEYVRTFYFNNASGAWEQLGQTIVGEFNGNEFGAKVDLSANGSVLVVGDCMGNGNGNGNGAGCVRAFAYNEGADVWQQMGQTIYAEGDNDLFGAAVALSASGTQMAVGGHFNDSNGSNAGQVCVFQYQASLTWTQMGEDVGGEAVGTGQH